MSDAERLKHDPTAAGLDVIDLRWGQDEPDPYLVPVPRIPCVGEKLVGPDDIGTLVVTAVTFVYAHGFYFPPSRVVVETRPG